MYVGVTNDIRNRLYQHRYENGSKFTTRYNCFDLIYYEVHPTFEDAIDREKQLKRWHKAWKSNLIRTQNPELKDLSEEVDCNPYDH